MATFDVHKYSDGREFVETDEGPNVWAHCGLCGAPACCTPDTTLAAIRCGQCLLRAYDMLPGQWVYQAKARYAAAFRAEREALRQTVVRIGRN